MKETYLDLDLFLGGLLEQTVSQKASVQGQKTNRDRSCFLNLGGFGDGDDLSSRSRGLNGLDLLNGGDGSSGSFRCRHYCRKLSKR